MSEAAGFDYQIARVSIPLPCTVRVRPGTPDTSGAIEERPEYCATNAWWFVGIAPICHAHLLEFLGAEEVSSIIAELEWPAPIPSANELEPWADRHRYDQKTATPLHLREDPR